MSIVGLMVVVEFILSIVILILMPTDIEFIRAQEDRQPDHCHEGKQECRSF
jgi:hypothetical protein